jgi:hypothetical protein
VIVEQVSEKTTPNLEETLLVRIERLAEQWAFLVTTMDQINGGSEGSRAIQFCISELARMIENVKDDVCDAEEGNAAK